MRLRPDALQDVKPADLDSGAPPDRGTDLLIRRLDGEAEQAEDTKVIAGLRSGDGPEL